MTGRATVRLPQGLLNRAKRKAAAEGRTLISLIADGLQLVTSANRRATKRARIIPRVSKATGGLMPGIDLTGFAGLQEMDDLEAIRRTKKTK
ncbi:MAG: hypothetical protein GEV13_05440 [Rhodospirillales bacterium]|nr:hypothetical protein [Rhodospirillales bacterium]